MLNVRLFSASDKERYLKFSKDFYTSGAALEPIPEEHMHRTFDALIADNPHADGFMILSDDIPVGYCLISFLWSTDMGGLFAVIDELYVCSDYQGHILGSAFLQYPVAGCIPGRTPPRCGRRLPARRRPGRGAPQCSP